jgi:cholesterol transport system auxiliary component
METPLPLHRRALLRWSALLPLALTAGCSLPGAGDPPREFLLSALPPSQSKQANGTPLGRLAVAEPHALRMLDSSRIIERAGPLEVQYFANADWADRAPTMLQMLIIRSIQNTTDLAVVRDDAPGPGAEFLLTSTLENFEADGQGVRVGLTATLTSFADRRELARTRGRDRAHGYRQRI